MRRDKEEVKNVGDEASRPEHQPPFISPMQPLTKEGYGGGLYGKDDDDDDKAAQRKNNQPASKTQSADGPEEGTVQPKHHPPPSTGDRDLDITGQSYIQ